MLVQILSHHLREDNIAPLRVALDGHILEPCNDFEWRTGQDGLHPDKVVIYSEFLSSNPQIKSVSCHEIGLSMGLHTELKIVN